MIGSWLQWNVNGKSWVPDQMVSFLMTLVTPNPGFKVTVYLQVEYLQNGASYVQSYYRTSIGNHTQSITFYDLE